MKKLLLLALFLCWPAYARADAVLQWNEIALRAAFAAGLDNSAGCVDPLHESRMMAMMHVAVHDALNAIDRRSRPYTFDAHAPAGTSADAAVAAAARGVLVATFPQLPAEIEPTPDAAIAIVEAEYASALAAIPPGPAKAAGILLGQSAAATIVKLRSGDTANAPFLDFAYVPGPNPGDFQLIPGLPFAAGPGWGDVTPFVLRSSSQYRPKRPYDLQSKKYAADFNEVKSLGAVNSTTRTDDQTEIALFWVEGSPRDGTGLPEPSRPDPGSIPGRARDCSGFSTWPRPTRISPTSRTSTSMNSGGRSARSGRRIPTAIRRRSRTRAGIHWWEPLPRQTIRQDTAAREGRCRRSSRDSSATRSVSVPPARHSQG